MKQFLDDLNHIFYDSRKEAIKKLLFPLIITAFIGILLAYYVSMLIDYIDVLTSIQHQQEYLSSEIQRLQEENANFQKEYFELKNLEPEH